MKILLMAVLCVFCFASCSRKTIPPKPNYTLGNNPMPDNKVTDTLKAAKGNIISTTVASSNTMLVIADGFGKLITPREDIPQDEGIIYNSLQLSKGFTVQQRANLQARYHTIPPRVLYVPQQNSLNSLKGDYYILNKKFWYWKKTDGLFYLDEKYYR